MFSRYYASVLFVSITLNLMLASDANAIYSAQTGRFLSRDPIGYVGDVSVYRYVNSRSLIYVDPAGTISEAPKTSEGPHDTVGEDGYPPYPVGNPNAGPILWPTPIDVWPPADEFEGGDEKCACKSLQGNRMRPTSPKTGKAPPVAGLPYAECDLADGGEVVFVKYMSSCEPDKDLPCKGPCKSSVCWEYVSYKCRSRNNIGPNSPLPDIGTEWVRGPKGNTKKSKCSL